MHRQAEPRDQRPSPTERASGALAREPVGLWDSGPRLKGKIIDGASKLHDGDDARTSFITGAVPKRRRTRATMDIIARVTTALTSGQAEQR